MLDDLRTEHRFAIPGGTVDPKGFRMCYCWPCPFMEFGLLQNPLACIVNSYLHKVFVCGRCRGESHPRRNALLELVWYRFTEHTLIRI